MSYFRRRLFLGFLFFIVLGVLAPFCSQPQVWASEFTAVKAGHFAPGKLEEHYLKHGYQFGQITEEQYLQGAQALLDADPGPDVLEKIRFNGDVEHFRPSTGEFAVMTKRGRIRTYYKTDYGYWISH
jgi:pyocin large subunit-like protein